LREAFQVLKNALTFTPARWPTILGDHVMVRSGDVVAAFVHLAPDSVAVREGQVVRAGDVIGRVGHTGNSTTPHLHFQLMDSADPLVARAVPCAFRSYEVLRGGTWQQVLNGIPGKADRIRLLDHQASPPSSGPSGPVRYLDVKEH
jgi:murein DD-endopeptidase MepM/ murein hydrolase activator NlpD